MRRVFTFPDTVNDAAARTVATVVVLTAAAAIAVRQPWLTIPLAYGFVARVAAGPTLSPLAQLATRVVAPRLTDHPRIVAGPPKRFAQAMGAAFTLTALALWLAGLTLGTYIVLGLLIIPATLEAALGYCVGCRIFGVLMRAGIVPETVCEECSDITARLARSVSA